MSRATITIELDEELLRQTEARAHREGARLPEVIGNLLQEYATLSEEDLLAIKRSKHVINERGIDLSPTVLKVVSDTPYQGPDFTRDEERTLYIMDREPLTLEGFWTEPPTPDAEDPREEYYRSRLAS